MVQIVTSLNRAQCEPLVRDMHYDRKRVFVDWLKWNVPVVEGRYEMDQFDGEDAIYLIESDRRTGKHLASLRLLPSTRPHLLKNVFPGLCDGDVPVGEEVFELTRFCVTPDVDKATALKLMNHMWVAAVEYALLFGVERYSCVSHRQLLHVMLNSGWDVVPLGPQRDCDGLAIGAILFTISPATLRECRRRFAYRAPVLEVVQVAQAA